MKQIHVTIWCENRHHFCWDARVPFVYPDGIHHALKQHLNSDDLLIQTGTLDSPDQGLSEELLNSTDVLLWWGHAYHDDVNDELVEKIRKRVVESGMGLIVLHSGHFSKIFRSLMGTSCSLLWRQQGEKERVWTVNKSHPIAQGIPETFVIPNSEMYGETFDIPDDGKIIFMSWFEGGNVFRNGLTFQRGNGKIFYFGSGHETFPIYHDENVIRILGNAIRWAAPLQMFDTRITLRPDAVETIRTIQPQ